jgi:Uma2 family endonuclease
MAEPATSLPLLPLEEYLRLERDSPVRHEFVCGAIHVLAGATRRHNRIVLNIARLLASSAEGGSSRVSIESVRVRVRHDVHYYPDVIVACEPEPDDLYIEEAPCVVVEVRSPSTTRVDRGEKLFFYRQMPSPRAYLIVDSERVHGERHWREADGEWRAEGFTHGTVPVPCPRTELPVAAAYAGTGLSG